MPTYHIKFDTESLPHHIVAVKVVLSKDVKRAKTQEELAKTFKINLCDDPLYADLVEYVKNNPLKAQHHE